jgi:hypothetical protein
MVGKLDVNGQGLRSKCVKDIQKMFLQRGPMISIKGVEMVGVVH